MDKMNNQQEENPFDEIDTSYHHHHHRSISKGRDRSTTRSRTRNGSPIFDRSDSFIKFQGYRHSEKKSNGNDRSSCSSRTNYDKNSNLQADKREKDRKSRDLESFNSRNTSLEFFHGHYSHERRNSPCFNDISVIRWPSESESSSSCDENETVPLSKFASTKRSVSDKKCLQRLGPSRGHLKKDTGTKRKRLNGFDTSKVELSRRGNKSKSKPFDIANDVIKLTCDENMNGQNFSKPPSALSDIHGFKKLVNNSVETKLTTPEKVSGASMKKWLPVTPNLFDSLSPSEFKFHMATKPETPFHVKCDSTDSSISKVKTAIPESPDIVFLGTSGPQFPTNSPSPRRKRAGISEIKRCRKKTKINETQSEDDILQLVEQIDKDEDFAKKLQEEMDKEFALSLAQGDTVHQLPVPQLPSLQLPFPALPPYNNEHNPFYQQHGWQTPTSLHRHTREPHFQRRGMPSEIDIENHLLALLEETPPRRGSRSRRGRGRRQPRSRYGAMLQSPIGDGNDYDALLQLAEQMGDVQQKGINNIQINRLPIKKFKKYDKNNSADAECSICMCEYVDNDCMRILPCFHCFHSGCVDKWLKNNASCPVCRENIKLD